MKTFFISDTHFYHDNVIRFDKRPFGSIDEMHEEMLRRWNEQVSPKDRVYILGDFSWRCGDEEVSWLRQLNGQLLLITGNHDFKHASQEYKKLFSSIKDYDEIVIPYIDSQGNLISRQRVILSHYYHPFYNSHFHGGIHLYGHSHNSPEMYYELYIQNAIKKKNSPSAAYNVGCMMPYMDYQPQTLEHIVTEGTKYQDGIISMINSANLMLANPPKQEM